MFFFSVIITVFLEDRVGNTAPVQKPDVSFGGNQQKFPMEFSFRFAFNLLESIETFIFLLVNAN